VFKKFLCGAAAMKHLKLENLSAITFYAMCAPRMSGVAPAASYSKSLKVQIKFQKSNVKVCKFFQRV